MLFLLSFQGIFIILYVQLIFFVVPLMYFGYFPILIIVFCWISTFVILFSNFSNLLSIIFIAFNISSNRVSILLTSILYVLSFSIRVRAFSLRGFSV